MDGLRFSITFGRIVRGVVQRTDVVSGLAKIKKCFRTSVPSNDKLHLIVFQNIKLLFVLLNFINRNMFTFFRSIFVLTQSINSQVTLVCLYFWMVWIHKGVTFRRSLMWDFIVCLDKILFWTQGSPNRVHSNRPCPYVSLSVC